LKLTELDFDGRVAVVTGAGGGLGRAYALQLAQRGAAIVVNDVGGSVAGTGADAAKAQQVVEEIQTHGGRAVASTASVTDSGAGQDLLQAALEEFGRLDILINNAGILRDKAFHKMTDDDFRAVVDVHLFGAFNVTQPIYAHMREQQYGRIVLTTSAAGLYGNFGQVNYSAAKLALVGMAKSLAHEGLKRNVKTNAISPAALSRMTEDLMPAGLGQAMAPDVVAPVVGYLAHESCALNGEVLTAFGGHVGRAFIGESLGVTADDLTIEAVADRLDEIRSLHDFAMPASPMDSLALLANTSTART
jgi:NAD(P)-dependent dehydrogenase (short-subunit alcohol dehydrogenase family)